jgi:hypothetical protein
MLGQVVARGYEAVRGWTCCLVQWGPTQVKSRVIALLVVGSDVTSFDWSSRNR